jgi:uncharacterized membrane protein
MGGMMEDTKGFFGSLFDLSFKSLIAMRIIKVLYVLAIILIGLYALLFIAGGFGRSTAAGLVVLVVIVPIFSLVSLIYTRVLLEVLIAVFRIMENTGELASRARALEPSKTSPASGPPPPLGSQ